MGREVKRVAENFSWPLNKVWEGFINPYYKHCKTCPFCDGSGVNPATKEISDEWYGIKNGYRNGWNHSITQDEVGALVEAGRLHDFTHDFIPGKGWQKKDPPYIPTADEVNEWSKRIFGHDAINKMICVEARAKRLGVYGLCEYCGGGGEIWEKPEYKILAEEWKEFEPPAGEWYQVWETTSEGSPISPAFKTPEELAKWLVENGASSFGRETATYEEWLAFIKGPAWAMSAVMHDGILESGVKAVTNADIQHKLEK